MSSGTLKRYAIDLAPSWEVGIRCIYVEVSTKTRTWSNGPILTDAQDFSYLSGDEKREIHKASKKLGGLHEVLDEIEEGKLHGIDPVKIRMVISGCKTGRPYLYVSTADEFMTEREVVQYAKEGESEY